MINNLPEDFKLNMTKLLGDEVEAFFDSLLGPRSYGLRVNPLKVNCYMDEFANAHADNLGIVGKVPWADEGYYYNEATKPGKNPLHEAGAYYIQEPSAMAVVQALDPKPGERILDLCAAPGGKSTHIAGRMMGQGLLISNEIVADRAKILARNIERMGIANCVVTNEPPDVMASRWQGFFHRVVVDAPCSGEGMFRKDDIAIEEWSKENVNMCAERQKMILNYAAEMVMPGGTMVYSTCTFEPLEDELVINDFLRKHSDWRLADTNVQQFLSPGLNIEGCDLSSAVRIWPHKNLGEGHFLAKLIKDGEVLGDIPDNILAQNRKKKSTDEKILDDVMSFLHTEVLTEDVLGTKKHMDRSKMSLNGDLVTAIPDGLDKSYLNGIKTWRIGLDITEIKKGRFEPAHALAMNLHPEDVRYSYECSLQESIKYLRGETIQTDYTEIKNGAWVLLCIDGISLGWGKYVNGIIKNHYPKGLRRDLL